MKKEMTYKGFTAQLMEADRLEGDDIHRLPPGMPLTVYHADEFLKLPDTWMKGSGVFVVPVKPNKGLWFDWRENDELNTAIIPTVKGCSPFTGMQTSGFHLERYEDKCPKHNCDFMGDRFCPECNYKWQPQNYVAHPNTLWWDTFVSGEDGIGRQFIFSEESNSVHSRGIKIPEQQYNYEKIKKGKGPKEVSIGAGGKIEQKLFKDPFPLDSWKETPDAVMTIYFVFQEKFEELKAGGMRDLKGKSEGMLDKLPVG